MSMAEIVHECDTHFHCLGDSQDGTGQRRFMEEMILKAALPIQTEFVEL